jgi:hypothetical protein
MLFFRGAEENHLAGFHFLFGGNGLDHEGMGSVHFSGDDGFEDANKVFVRAADSDDDGGGAIGQGASGPLAELGEIEEECGFDLILGGRGLLGAGRRRRREECEANEQGWQGRDEATPPWYLRSPHSPHPGTGDMKVQIFNTEDTGGNTELGKILGVLS